MSYCNQYIGNMHSYYYRYDYAVNIMVEIVSKILSNQGSIDLQNIYEFAEKALDGRQANYYLDSQSSISERAESQELAELLYKLYEHSDCSSKLKEKIANLIFANFSLAQDAGSFNHFTPKIIYKIVANWLEDNFEERIVVFTELMKNQYDELYRKFIKQKVFDGWEFDGRTVSCWSGTYHLADRAFVQDILKPAIEKFYSQNPDNCWQFIKKYCLSTTNQVSRERPDFLNRTVYDILLKRFASDDQAVSKEALDVLTDFILAKKGNPLKVDLVYQSLVTTKMSDTKKWMLLGIALEKNGLPSNVFIEQIASQLVRNGHQESRKLLKQWIKDPKYYNRFAFDQYHIANIRSQLDMDLDYAIELFTTLIHSEYANSDSAHDFSAYQAAELLRSIILKDYQKGCAILRELESVKEWSTNQQIIYTSSLFNTQVNMEVQDLSFLEKIYYDAVKPFLVEHDNNAKIVARIPFAHARNLVVQFAAQLANKKKISEAMSIIRIFVNDLDPIEQSTDIEQGKAPQTITTVRGWCAWALMHCAVLEGREHLHEIIQLTRKLVNDENYYVVHLACFALAQIAKNRLSVMPHNSDQMFFNDDMKAALQMAKDVEGVAFALLERFAAWPSLVQEAMTESILKVFNSIKSLTESDATRLVNVIDALTDKAIGEFLPLLLYYAEFRKETYRNWKLMKPGLYDDLGPDQYDDTQFKNLLFDLIQRLQGNDLHNCFELASALEGVAGSISRSEKPQELEAVVIKYLNQLTNKYNDGVFHIAYRIIESRLDSARSDKIELFDLYVKCLRVEAQHRIANPKLGIASALTHSDILKLIYEKMGGARFLDAFEIVASFSEQIFLHKEEQVKEILKSIIQADCATKIKACEILKLLEKKNPNNYREFRKSLFK